jgi:hypothetical protein
MNLYILVEGRSTERKVYPVWLKQLMPALERVATPTQAIKNNYFLISGEGYPRMLDVTLPKSIEDIMDCRVYNYFVIVLDADNFSVTEREAEVQRKIAALTVNLGPCEVKIIVQNKCFESWALGNRTIFSLNRTTPTLLEYIKFFNVAVDDPELMTKPVYYDNSMSEFHYDYLREMLLMRNIRYTKKYPQDVAKAYYLDALRKRIHDSPTHLASFQNFITFCATLQAHLTV